ncbi:CinA family protein [Paenalcaligenes niemegkensis]|uniref:CinA family protein n=1 Tax=Paenalcaligenes niemegkensis TaxID=2895469 RepID=UPI001EE8344E|nr:CinA family protein [Paenalcaligenes niemegkensis]MCQ9616476.1 CinA family protein [Paenalcaligenes niemegkensis]
MKTIGEVVKFMQRESLTLVTAESCTAGLIAATIADIEGAGQLLDCAFVTYSPEAKKRCLEVRQETLDNYNLSSEKVACEMAMGALAHSPATLAISNTGVADDTDDVIPAGTQCFAWAFRGQTSDVRIFSETKQFFGDRNEIREASARYALERIPHYFHQR